jgi:hypothetical protein
MPIGDKPELYSGHKHLISNVSIKNRIFFLDLEWTLVYPAATLQEVKTVEAWSAFIHAAVNTHCPITTLERKEEIHR